VIFESLKRCPIELGVTYYMARRIDEGYSVAGGDSRLIGQSVGIDSRSPLRRQQPCLACEVVGCLIRNARVDLIVDDDYYGYDHDRDDRERLKKQPMRESHDLSLTFRMR
jgi:hypothetical protein